MTANRPHPLLWNYYQPGDPTMTTHNFPGFSSPSASTEAPLEMLAACHGRVEQQCRTLLRLPPHLQAHGADESARQAARAVMRYFDTAAQDHHADEEQDLFPTLLSVAMESADEAQRLRDLTQALLADHQRIGGLWRELRQALAAVAEAQAIELPLEPVQAFVAAYRRHIELEEGELLPLAARLLSQADIGRIGAAMRQRRGIAAID